jgi:hypothetical protein
LQAEEEVDEKQDELLKEAPLPENGSDSAPAKKAMPKSNSAAALADLRKKKERSGGGAAASEGELTVKESRATGRSPAAQSATRRLSICLCWYGPPQAVVLTGSSGPLQGTCHRR